MIRIAIIETDAASLDDLLYRLHHSGGAALSPSDVASLNVWLPSHEPGLLVLKHSKESERAPAIPAGIPMPGRSHGKTQPHGQLNFARPKLTVPDGKVIPLTHSEGSMLRVAANTHGRLVSR